MELEIERVRDFAERVFSELYPGEQLTVNFLGSEDMPQTVAYADMDNITEVPTLVFNLGFINEDYKHFVIHEIAHIVHLRGLGYDKMTDLEQFLISYEFHRPDWRYICYSLASKYGVPFNDVKSQCDDSRRMEVDLSGHFRRDLVAYDESVRAEIKKRDRDAAEVKEYKRVCRVNGWTLLDE